MPFTFALGSTANVDPIGRLDDEVAALNALLDNQIASSAVNVQFVKLRKYCYEGRLMSVEQTADPTLPLRDVQHSHVKDTITFLRALVPGYRSVMFTTMWMAKQTPWKHRQKMQMQHKLAEISREDALS